MWDDNHLKERRRVARRLRELRLARGITQTELSRMMGFAHPSSISSIEHGRRPIYEDELPILAKALECTVNDVVPEQRGLSSLYPVPRSRLGTPLAAITILLQFVAEGVQAEEHVPRTPQFHDQLTGQDGRFMAEPDLPESKGQPQPPLPPIWGDNCDPTLSMTEEPIVG